MTTSNFSDTIQEARLQRRWSQKQLAQKLNTTRVTISRWEHGISTPSPLLRQALKTVLNISEKEEDVQELPDPVPSYSGPEQLPPLVLKSPKRVHSRLDQGSLDWTGQRMTLQLKQFQYVRDQVEMLLPLFDPHATQDLRLRMLELLFQQIEHDPQLPDSAFLLPSFAQIKSAFVTAKQERDKVVEQEQQRKQLQFTQLDTLTANDLREILPRLNDLAALSVCTLVRFYMRYYVAGSCWYFFHCEREDCPTSSSRSWFMRTLCGSWCWKRYDGPWIGFP